MEYFWGCLLEIMSWFSETLLLFPVDIAHSSMSSATATWPALISDVYSKHTKVSLSTRYSYTDVYKVRWVWVEETTLSWLILLSGWLNQTICPPNLLLLLFLPWLWSWHLSVKASHSFCHTGRKGSSEVCVVALEILLKLHLMTNQLRLWFSMSHSAAIVQSLATAWTLQWYWIFSS